MTRLMRTLAIAVLAACSSPATVHASPPQPLVDADLVLVVTPAADHQPFVLAIDAATATIDMTMFHLTDPAIVGALTRAATRGVQVRVILDGSSLKTKKFEKAASELRHGGVQVRGSSPAFSITHEKAMVVDGKLAFVTAINLTRDVDKTRDFGIVTHATGVVADVAALFATDWDNAASGGNTTPALHEPSLVLSPTTSRAKLTGLIGAAGKDIIATVENLGDPSIADALIAAAKRGVAVRLIVPMCDKNPDPLYDVAPAGKLAARGVTVRMMPAPETATQPYMHSKMIQIDGATTYVGSVNFSTNSIAKARELGIVFANPAAAQAIAQTFEADWKAAVVPPATPPSCPAGE
jgi:cardiolipin synthase A/B